jgi:hypothetical protein
MLCSVYRFRSENLTISLHYISRSRSKDVVLAARVFNLGFRIQ